MTLAREPRLQPELYFLEGYYTAPPPIDPTAWQTRLTAYLGHVEAIGDGDTPMFALHDYRCDYADRPGAPTMITLLASPAEAPDADALQQSWGWMEAADIVPRCPYILIINEFLGRLLDPNQRLHISRSIRRVLIELTEPQAVRPLATNRYYHPHSWLDAGDEQPYYGLINVRYYTISNHPGDSIMDTRGLSVFGVPDLQCHYRDLEPDAVAQQLYNTAIYLLEHGDIIADGHTLTGSNGEPWRCRHEDSLLEPSRLVLDICPNAPYAAGNRDD